MNKQLDPSAVAQKRSIQGSRYDMVDRNYEIVLEYKEKEGVFELDLAGIPEALLEGDTHIMQPLVRSKYSITAVNWKGDVAPLSMTATAGVNNPQGWTITLPEWNSTPNATNSYHLSITLTDEKGRQVTSNTVEVMVGQKRKGTLEVENGGVKPATGLESDAVQLVAYLSNHENKVISDLGMTPRWIVKDAETGTTVTVSESCENGADGKAAQCVSLKSENTEVRDGVNYHVLRLASTLPGRYRVTADLGIYGLTRSQEIVFKSETTLPEVARAEIQAPNGEDILAAQTSPQVGVSYSVKLFNAANEDVTSSFPPESLRWVLDGNASAAGCDVTLTDHDNRVEFGAAYPGKQAIYLYPSNGSYPLIRK